LLVTCGRSPTGSGMRRMARMRRVGLLWALPGRAVALSLAGCAAT
jgi:hypothetical protein